MLLAIFLLVALWLVVSIIRLSMQIKRTQQSVNGVYDKIDNFRHTISIVTMAVSIYGYVFKKSGKTRKKNV